MRLMILVCAVFVAGCSTYKAYDGLERPTSEIVTVNNSSQFAFWSFVNVYSIDNQCVIGQRTMAVLPGAHRFQVFDTRRSKLAMLLLLDAFYEEAICGFTLDAAPGTEFTLVSLDSDGLVSTNGRKVYRASMEIEERFAGSDSVTRHIPVECASFDLVKRGWFEPVVDVLAKGFLCQANADCLAEGTVCVQDAGYAYGICSKPK